MSTTLIDEITVVLNNMKETGKVDLSLAKNLDALATVFKESQEKWLTSRNARVGIFLYYAARNCALVVSRMKERFLSLNEGDGNVKIADESLQVVGLIRDLLDLTRKEKPDEGITKLVIERVRQLRAAATNIKLVQAQEKELEDVDKLFNYLSKLKK